VHSNKKNCEEYFKTPKTGEKQENICKLMKFESRYFKERKYENAKIKE
jgi:hypothetical protein